MIAVLAHRLEIAGRCDMELDAQLLEWLAELPQIGRSEMWLRHSYGLVGNLTGAERLLEDLFRGCHWGLRSILLRGEPAFLAHLAPGLGLPVTARAPVAANAMLAAVLRGHLQILDRKGMTP